MATITKNVCVIGSGFGGGVSALRMAEAGQSVVVLEQGHFWDSVINQAWSSMGVSDVKTFEQKNGDFNYWMDIFNFAAGANLLTNSIYAVISGRGVGGGGLVYSGVSLRAPSGVFSDAPWPQAIDRAALDPYYTKAENQLQVNQFGWGDVGYKDGAFAWAAKNAGVTVNPHPSIIDNQVCGSMGWCNNGCLRGAKHSADRQYMKPAMQAGVEVLTGAMALEVAPLSGGKWQVTYSQGDSSTPNLLWTGTTSTVVADQVFICAGAVNSAAILLRSARNLPGGVSSQTGKNLSRDGDGLIIGILPDDLPASVEGVTFSGTVSSNIGTFDLPDMTIGPVDGVTCFNYMFEPPPGFGPDWPKFTLQPVRMLPMAAALTLDPAGALNPSGNMETFGVGAKHLMQKYGSRMLQIGTMGMDGMDGEVTLTPAGTPTVSFTDSQQTINCRNAQLAGVKQIIENGAGGKVLPIWNQYRPGDGYTIHPLGSCRMADSVIDGVVRDDGAVWNPSGGVYNGLHVLDCSVMSSPIAVNTSLTTAALAERALALITGS
ncbi:MAG: GMC family oxidoreductase N-terminal domain-containing protein [Actinomycetota bacterium]|jgi:cholesterol oxidase|nr:GMC family oxidoreductase N-terminal domain-containing protein [Actinomycetota bacterium]